MSILDGDRTIVNLWNLGMQEHAVVEKNNPGSSAHKNRTYTDLTVTAGSLRYHKHGDL